MTILKKTALFDLHHGLNAKMVPFAGFEMPVQYSSVKDEVLSTRQEAGIFDVGHMGEFFVEGPETNEFIDYIITNDFLHAPIGKAVYSPLCREDGTIIDDLIAYKLSEKKSLLCVNAANIEKDFDWVSLHAKKFDVNLTNESDNFSLLAIQGPSAQIALLNIPMLKEAASLDYYGVKVLEKNNLIVSRTGYTGEDGFEIFCTHATAIELWTNFISQGVRPCGLASRDVLRLEVCYPLYGHELDDKTTPFDTGLKWAVKMKKKDFLSKSFLENYQPIFSLEKIILPKGIPRAGYSLCDQEMRDVGEITSGTLSPVLGKGIALCRVNKSLFQNARELYVRIRDKNYCAEKHTGPFVKGGHK